MYKKTLMVCSIVMFVFGLIQIVIYYFTGDALVSIRSFASFTFAYAMGVQVGVIELREKISKLSL